MNKRIYDMLKDIELIRYACESAIGYDKIEHSYIKKKMFLKTTLDYINRITRFSTTN